MSEDRVEKRRMLEFRSGGWILMLGGVLVVAAVAVRIPAILEAGRNPVTGDGIDVDSYRFDFSTCLVPRGQLVASRFSKDGISVLDEPRMLSVVEADELHRKLRRQKHTKYLVSSDRVVGVEIDGDARAYPLRLLGWHQVVNDTVGGRPVVVTYDPLCDSSVVFDRRVDEDVLTFGFSGLLYNSNLLLYDRRPNAIGESLWSQLQFRAIAGPAALKRSRLRILTAVVVRWEDWRERHPETTVMAPLMDELEFYKMTYSNYYGSDKIRFPVEPLAPSDSLPLMAPVLAMRIDGKWRSIPFRELAERGDGKGRWSTTAGGKRVTLGYRSDPPTAWASVDGPVGDFVTITSFRFAWHAMHPGTEELPRERQ